MLDTAAAFGKEIMPEDHGNPKEQVRVKMGFGKDTVGALPGTGNHGGKVPDRDSLPVQPVPDHRAYMHIQKECGAVSFPPYGVLVGTLRMETGHELHTRRLCEAPERCTNKPCQA